MKNVSTQLLMKKHHSQQICLEELRAAAKKGDLLARKRIYELEETAWLSRDRVDIIGAERAAEAAEGWHRLAELADIVKAYKQLQPAASERP